MFPPPVQYSTLNVGLSSSLLCLLADDCIVLSNPSVSVFLHFSEALTRCGATRDLGIMQVVHISMI